MCCEWDGQGMSKDKASRVGWPYALDAAYLALSPSSLVLQKEGPANRIERNSYERILPRDKLCLLVTISYCQIHAARNTRNIIHHLQPCARTVSGDSASSAPSKTSKPCIVRINGISEALHTQEQAKGAAKSKASSQWQSRKVETLARNLGMA